MPEIPVSQKNFLPSGGQPVYMSSAPGMSFGMETSEQLHRAGQTIAGAGMQLGEAVMRHGSLMDEFKRKAQDNENRLAAMELKNIWKEKNNALIQRMAERPGDFADFGDWARETDQEYEAAAGEYLDRMDEDFRKGFEIEMAGVRADSIHDRELLSLEGKSTAMVEQFNAGWQRACLAGDIAEADRLRHEFRDSGLISPERFSAMGEEQEALLQFGEVKRLVDAGDTAVVEALKQRSEAGYKNYTLLSEAQREQFIRAGEAAAAANRAATVQSFVEELWQGTLYSPEDIDTKFPGDSSEDVALRNSLKQAAQPFMERAERERREAANAEAAAANAAAAAANAAAAAANAAAQAKAQEDYKALEWEAYSIAFDTDSNIRQRQYDEMKTRIYANYAGDKTKVANLMKLLDDSLAAFETPDDSYKNTFIYTATMERLNAMQGDFKFDDFSGGVWEDAVVAANFQEAVLMVDKFLKANPHATLEEVETYINNLKAEVNDKHIKHLMGFWLEKR